jgi:hypothetical protein
MKDEEECIIVYLQQYSFPKQTELAKFIICEGRFWTLTGKKGKKRKNGKFENSPLVNFP